MSDALLELQGHTIAMQTASMKAAGAAIADAQVEILAQRSAIAHYESVLATIAGNLQVAKASPMLAPSMIEQTIELALSTLRGGPRS